MKFTNSSFAFEIPKDRLTILADATDDEFTAAALAEFTSKHAEVVAQLQHGIRDAIEYVDDMEPEGIAYTFAERIAAHVPGSTFEGSIALSFGQVTFQELGRAYLRHVSNKLKTITLTASDDIQVITMDGTKVLVKLSELQEKVGSIPTDITVSEEDGYAMPTLKFDKLVSHGVGKVSAIDLEDSVIQGIKDAYMDELNARINDSSAVFPTNIRISYSVDDPEQQEKVNLYCMCIGDYIVRDRVSAINPFEFTYSSQTLCKIRDCSDYIELATGHLVSLDEVSNAYQNFGISKISQALEEDDEYIDTADAGRVYVDFEDVLEEVNDIRATTVAEAAMALSYTAEHIKSSIADRFAMVKERVMSVVGTVQGKASSILAYAQERLSSIPSVGAFLEHTVESSGISEAASSDEYTFSNSPHYLYTGVSPASAFTFNTLKKVVGQTVKVAAEAVMASFSAILYGAYQAAKSLYAGWQAVVEPYDVTRTGKGISPTVEGVSFTRLTPLCNMFGVNSEAFSGGVKMDLRVAEILMYSGKIVIPSVSDRMPEGMDNIWEVLQLQPVYVRGAQTSPTHSAILDIITNQAGLVVSSDFWDTIYDYYPNEGDDFSYARSLVHGFVCAYLHYRSSRPWLQWLSNSQVETAVNTVLWYSPINWNGFYQKGFTLPSNPLTMYEFIGKLALETDVDGTNSERMCNTLINALAVCLYRVWNMLVWDYHSNYCIHDRYFMRTIIKYKPVDYRFIHSDLKIVKDGSEYHFEFNPVALRSITYTDPDEEETLFGDCYMYARVILEGIELHLSEGNLRLGQRPDPTSLTWYYGQPYSNATWYRVLSTGRAVGMNSVCPFIWAVASASHYNDYHEDRVFVPYITKLSSFLPSLYRLKTDEENIALYERLMTGVIIATVVSAAALTLSVLIKRAHRKFSMKAEGQRRAFENTLAATGEWDKDSWRKYKKSVRVANLLSALSGGAKTAPVKAFKSMEISDLLPKKDDPVPFKVDTKPLQDSIDGIRMDTEPLRDSLESIRGLLK